MCVPCFGVCCACVCCNIQSEAASLLFPVPHFLLSPNH